MRPGIRLPSAARGLREGGGRSRDSLRNIGHCIRCSRSHSNALWIVSGDFGACKEGFFEFCIWPGFIKTLNTAKKKFQTWITHTSIQHIISHSKSRSKIGEPVPAISDTSWTLAGTVRMRMGGKREIELSWLLLWSALSWSRIYPPTPPCPRPNSIRGQPQVMSILRWRGDKMTYRNRGWVHYLGQLRTRGRGNRQSCSQKILQTSFMNGPSSGSLLGLIVWKIMICRQRRNENDG